MARVLISMPEQFLTQIDSVAQGENRTRALRGRGLGQAPASGRPQEAASFRHGV